MTDRLLVSLLWLVPAGVLVQAALAGQAWFHDPELFGLHGGLGHGVLVLSAAAVALSWLTRAPAATRWLSMAVLLALVAQTGLGYAGHRGGVVAASSLHVPVGVAILGTAVAAAVVHAGRDRPAGARTPDQRSRR